MRNPSLRGTHPSSYRGWWKFLGHTMFGCRRRGEPRVDFEKRTRVAWEIMLVLRWWCTDINMGIHQNRTRVDFEDPDHCKTRIIFISLNHNIKSNPIQQHEAISSTRRSLIDGQLRQRRYSWSDADYRRCKWSHVEYYCFISWDVHINDLTHIVSTRTSHPLSPIQPVS